MQLRSLHWVLAGTLAGLTACASDNASRSSATQGPPMPPMEEIERVDPIAPNPQRMNNHELPEAELAQFFRYKTIVFTNLRVSDTSSNPPVVDYVFGRLNGHEIEYRVDIDGKEKLLRLPMGFTGEMDCSTRDGMFIKTSFIFNLGGTMQDKFTCPKYDASDNSEILKRFQYTSEVKFTNGIATLNGHWKEDGRGRSTGEMIDFSMYSNIRISFRISGSQCELLDFHLERTNYRGTPRSGKPRFYDQVVFDRTTKSTCVFSVNDMPAGPLS
jgi:hypothetical protein